MIAHHCKKDYVALWLKPMNELELAGHLIKQSLGYQMVVSHPHTGLEYFRIDEVEKYSWAFWEDFPPIWTSTAYFFKGVETQPPTRSLDPDPKR